MSLIHWNRRGTFLPYDQNFGKLLNSSQFLKKGTMNKSICAGLIASATLAYGDTLTLPTQYADTDAPGAGGLFAFGSLKHQEIFDASDFSNIPEGGILISGFSWRPDNPDPGAHGGAVTIPSVEVFASTSSRTSASLSPVFSDNIGQDNTLVRAAAPLNIDVSFPKNGPSPFSITFSFDKPFAYNPKDGSLLIELHIAGANISPGNIDFSSPFVGEGVGFASQGDLSSQTYGFAPVTQLSYQSVPEPEVLRLGLLAIIIFFLRGQKKHL
jgi:hypothetical protein